MNVKKISVLIVYLFFLSATLFFAPKYEVNKNIEFFTVSDKVKDAPRPIETLSNRHNVPIDYYFGNVIPSPFSFNVVLNPDIKTGQRSLWLYASRTGDHGTLHIEHNGTKFKGIVNQLESGDSRFFGQLQYVGDITVSDAPVTLHVTSVRDGAPHHFMELGLFVLSPPNTPEAEINAFIDEIGKIQFFDTGYFALILCVSFLTLAFFARSVTLNLYSFGTNGICSAIILCCVLAVTSYAFFYRSSPILLNTSQSVGIKKDQTGTNTVESQIQETMQAAANRVKPFLNATLPSSISLDNVPENMKKSEGTFETNIFFTNEQHDFSGFFSNLLGGLYQDITTMPIEALAVILITMLNIILSSLILCCFVRVKWPFALISLIAISLLSCLLSVRMSDGWDALFINLRHAQMLVQHGMYSINANIMAEGTVEFLPLIVTALFGFIGFDLLNSLIYLTLAGNVILVLVSFFLVKKLTLSDGWALLSALLIGIHPMVLGIGATGLSFVLFTSFALGASYGLLFSDKKRLGLILLALLPLIRIEGILFAALLMSYTHLLKPFIPSLRMRRFMSFLRQLATDVSFVAAPFLFVSVMRYALFGSVLPIPTLFKNTYFNKDYAIAGVDRFLDFALTHILPLIVLATCVFGLIFLLGKLLSKVKVYTSIGLDLIILNIIVFLFTLPYFTEAGDGLPLFEKRYGMLFSLVLLLTFLIVLYRTFFGTLRGWARTAGVLTFFSAFLIMYSHSLQLQNISYIQEATNRLQHATPNPYIGWGNLNNKAVAGQFLNSTLPSNAVIAGTEEAAIMYYGEHPMLGLSGLTDLDIASQPLQPIIYANPLYRKRAYQAIFTKYPDIILTLDSVQPVDFREAPQTRTDIRNVVQHQIFNGLKVHQAYYQIGSMEALKKAGYRHITVSYSNILISFFIHEKIYDQYVSQLNTKGFKNLGTQSIDYHVASDIQNHFIPATQDIMAKL